MRTTLLTVHVIGMSLTLGACLTEGTRRGTDTTGDTQDTSGDTGVDTSDTSADTEVVDLCLGQSCDDNDPCTYDVCDPSTGECQHLGLPGVGEPPMPSCVNDADCDDGQACTTDTCVTFAENCGIGTTRCVHELIPGCGGCASGCDDGDPCTHDACVGDACVHEPLEGCLSECVEAGTMSIASIRSMGFGYRQPVKTVGQLFFPPLYAACDDGPDCGCVGFSGLIEGTASLVLKAPANGAEEWACKSSGCGVVMTQCQPAQFGVRYRAWGAGLAEWDLVNTAPVPAAGDPPGAAVPAVMVAGVEVEGYCLETVITSLIGQYAGELEIAGTVIQVKAHIAQDLAPVLRISEPTCANGCPEWVRFDQTSFPISVGDGYVDVSATLPGLGGGSTEWQVRLYSNRNQLWGRFGFGLRAGVAIQTGGTIALTRLPAAQ